MDNVLALAQNFNAADILWIIGAVILIGLAIKVAAKILKFVLGVGAILLVVAFLFNIFAH